MIKIHEVDDLKVISTSVSNFSDSLGYCEHKIPFHLEGITAPPSVETIQGTKAHKKEEVIEEEQFEFEPITTEQLTDITNDIEFKREKVYTKLQIPFNIGSEDVLVSLFGRADKVYRINETLVVQDDKFPTNLNKYKERYEPYPDQILQALTYLNSLYSDKMGDSLEDWFDIPHKEKSWIIQIKDKHNQNEPYKIFRGTQTDEALGFLHYNIERFAKLVLGVEEREHHNSANKCKPCRYADKCEFVIK